MRHHYHAVGLEWLEEYHPQHEGGPDLADWDQPTDAKRAETHCADLVADRGLSSMLLPPVLEVHLRKHG